MRRSIAASLQFRHLLVLPLAALAWAGTGVSLAANIPFGPQQIISTSDSHGLAVISGDLDGDGDLDIVASAGTNSPSGVYWYKNLDGKGTYSTSHLIDDSSGGLSNRVSIALADMDGDGDLDLLTGWAYLGAWYPNDGNGNFGARTVIRDEQFNGSWYTDFQAVDIDGDGDLDVAAVAGSVFYAANKVVWFRNNGGGSFNPATENLVGSLVNDDTARIVPADMDGDGDIDLVTMETGGNDYVVWYRNLDGAGTFSAKQTISVGSFFSLADIAVADIDGDGDLDVVSSDYSFSADRWHENTAGDGSAWTDHLMGVSDTYSFFTNTADMDGDGDVDVLVASRVSNQAAWLENNGTGTAWTRRVAATSVDYPLAGIAADVDGDGDPDVVTASFNDNKIAWNENRTIHRNAKFDSGVNMDATVSQATEPRIVDLDGDGDPDVVAALRQNGLLVWFDNDGTSPATWPLRNVATGIPNFTESSAVADIDGDGDPDVTISPGGGLLHWYQNNGGLPPTFTDRTITSTLSPGIDVVAGDIDGDGDIDLIALSYTALSWYENDGAALPGWTERSIGGAFTNSRDLLLADLDGDGDLDAVATNNSAPTLRWYENNGASPPIWTERSILSPADPLSVEATDIDGDGDIDLVTACIGDTSVRWFENTGGAPIVWVQRTVATGIAALTAFPADLDHDGDIDVLTGSNGTSPGWYESNGGAPPLWTQHSLPSFNIKDWSVTDLNGDGDVDLIGSNVINGSVDAFENSGGQYGFTTTSATSGLAYNGEASPLLTIGVEVHGRPGDSVGRLDSVKLLFQRNPDATALTTSEANGLIDELRIYRDDGSGAFETGQDYPVATLGTLSLTAGVQTIAVPSSDPNARVAAPAKFFVVAVMMPDASSQPLNIFRVTHLAVSGSVVVDANAGITLTGESTTDVTAGPITARPRFVVNSFGDAIDAVPGDGNCATAGAVCTLRAAVMESNAFAGSDRIALAPGTYVLTVGFNAEDLAAQGDLDIIGPLTIGGAGAVSTIISGGGIDRIFDVRGGGSLVLENVRLEGGFVSGAPNPGGAIRTNSSGSLTVRRCDLRNNQANVGGAIANMGTTVVEDSLIYNNVGAQSEAFQNQAGPTTLRNVTISGNTGANAVVGVNAGTIIVDGCTITGNGAEGLKNFSGAPPLVRNTVVAGNALAIAGAFTSQGYNLIDDVGSATGFMNGVNNDKVGGGANPVIDAKLRVLGDYGGPTLTHQLLTTSPAIDAGSCGALTADQRGVKRPIDVAGVANVGDGCDIGAYELESGALLSRVEVPVRWCGLHGSPSIENPSLMGASNVTELLRRRHEAATDNIYAPQTGIIFRSAASAGIQSYPVLEDPDCTYVSPGNYTCARGVRGDVYIGPDIANFDEYEELIASCRAAWQALDPKIEGVTAVQINHFVDKNGTPLSILGIGGRAREGDAREQAEAGRVAVVDHFYRQAVPGNPNPPNPSDTIDRLLSHELGHALSLRHGDGLDNDNNGSIDDNDEAVVGLPRFDGDNIMQYRAGTRLSAGQATQARNHLAATVPDVTIQPISDAAPDAVPIDPRNIHILDFGFDGVLNLANARLLDFKNAVILDFENNNVPDFANARLLDFKNANLLDFQNARILDFGMSYNGETAGGSTSLHATTAAIPWPASLRPKTRYFYYLDLDRDDGTGAYPADKVNPSDAPNHFPGSSNLVAGNPKVGEEAGVDLIAQVEIQSTCVGTQCSSTSVLKIFDYNDGIGAYVEVSSTPSPAISSVEAGLYVDNGGAPVDLDTAPTGITVQPVIPNSLLFAAGWGFTTPPGGGAPVPKPIRMEVLTTIGCVGNVLNDGSAANARNCQCTSCASCPDYPGCTGTVGTPQTLTGTTILTDHRDTELTFQPPILPACTVIPALASQGQAVTVYVTQLPTNLSGTVEVSKSGAVIGTTPTGSISAVGTVSVAATLPSTALGQVTLSAGITGSAPRAQCLVTVTPTLACPDSDGDGVCNSVDTDDDNDGVADGADSAPLNRLVCRDVDADQCDDCASGTNAPLLDGPDYDLDGLCDRGDPDDDNDGVLDAADGQPKNANACGDIDGDSCDDCVIAGTPSPGNDGPDADGDGICDFGDVDADNDGTANWLDCAPNDGTLRAAAAEVVGVGMGSGANKNRVTWFPPQTQGGSATVSDLLRGTGAGLPVGSGAETCLVTGTSAAQFDDAIAPASGQMLWYLVRARNACGNGNYGKTSGGVVRTSSACP